MGFSVTEAVDAIYKRFTDEWNKLASPPKLLYDDFGQTLPGTDEHWARIQIRHSGGGQSTLQERGQREFERIGIVTVQLFSVLNEGRQPMDSFMQTAMRAFEKQAAKKLGGSGADEVWFRNVQSNEIGRNEGWYQVNVTAQFEYDFRELPPSELLLIDDSNDDTLLIDDNSTTDELLVE